MGRYKDFFGIKTVSDIPTTPSKISDRPTDIYITYNAADRLDLVSSRIYGRPDYWWVILLANGYSIEYDIDEGEILRVPFPLEDVIGEVKK